MDRLPPCVWRTLGAEVIKIEPLSGDAARSMGPPFIQDVKARSFLSLNRNKKSVALDATTHDGREVAQKLIARAECCVGGLRAGPGRKKLGLGYADLSQSQATLVYCAISAFGEEGPLRDQPGAELVVQALADYTHSLGKIGEAPVRLGTDVASLNTGIMASQAITAGLFSSLCAKARGSG